MRLSVLFHMQEKFDFIVVGSGIAGLSFGLKAAQLGKVCIITKSDEDESNTKYAQGGVAVVTDLLKDSFEKHIADTLDCGDGACDEQVVDFVIKEGPARIREIIAMGARFDQNEAGYYDLAREGGHSVHRVLHHKDMTGFEIERTLLEQIYANPNITLYSHKFAVDLITQHHLGQEVNKKTDNIRCFGVYVLNTSTNEIETILAKSVVLATGGAGHVYQTTTNPVIATGDGIAMAYRAKAKLRNMEFIQFHPTALYNPGEHPAFLISEAVRGYGGVLKNQDGKEFMHKYDKRKSLAPRDITARAIDNELKKTGNDYVLLDCRHIPEDIMMSHFPNIYQKCLSIGIDMRKEAVPVAPAMHYLVGGIQVDEYGRTNIAQLYACGECASTGLHGANRLASNSLLEATVFADRIYKAVSENHIQLNWQDNIPDWNDSGTSEPDELVLISQNLKETQAIMNSYVGIVRNKKRLDRAWERLEILHKETERLYTETKLSVRLLEQRNILKVAYTIVKCAKMREESRGLHYTTDYPKKAPLFTDTVI
jgi:L-aspartate oxidase